MITIRLIDARHGLSCKCRELFKNERIADEIYNYLCDGLEECKNVKPEQKKGKWIHNPDPMAGDGYWNCSECGYDAYDCGKYCPNCGADMRGEQE